MINNKYDLEYLKYLYENIFEESVDNSKEIANFVANNPHPLRIKVEDWLSKNGGLIDLNFSDTQQGINAFVNKILLAYELDLLIMTQIENE